MKNVYVMAMIGNERHYLHSLYPINWSPFISGATKFVSIEEARMTVNCIYKNLFNNDDNFNIDSFYSIRFITVENAVVTDETPYVIKEG